MSRYDIGVVRETGMRRLDRMGMAIATFEPTERPVQEPMPMQELYEFKLNLRADFWANPSMRDSVAKEAYRHLMCLLHREEMDALHQIRMAVVNNDKDECMTLIARIQGMLQGDE